MFSSKEYVHSHKTMDNNTNKGIDNFLWFLHYVGAAKELLETSKDKKYKGNIAPALFCLRHALELLFKTFSLEERKTHNFRNISTLVLKRLGPESKKRIEKLFKKEYTEETVEEMIEVLEEERVKKISNLVSFLESFSGKLDKNNIGFRYPSQEVIRKIEKLSWEEIETIGKDAGDLLVIGSIILISGSPDDFDCLEKKKGGLWVMDFED